MPKYEGYEDSEGNFWRECCCQYDSRAKGCDICANNPVLPFCFGCLERVEQKAPRLQHRRDLEIAGCAIRVRVTIHWDGDCVNNAAKRFTGLGAKVLEQCPEVFKKTTD